MKHSFLYYKGTKPILISMPHNASLIPESVAKTMTIDAQFSKDTDWYIDRLYDFSAKLGVHTLQPKWSRYYIDLNRDPLGQDLYPGADNTELCPTTDFARQSLYQKAQVPDHNEIELRIKQAWKPYHQCIDSVLKQMLDEHGYAILFDAHSIRSIVPRFFDGQLNDFNFGTAGGLSCDPSILQALESLNYQPWNQVSNGRFKGGYITRHYGDPENNIHAVQLELSQATYLNEDNLSWNCVKADKVKIKLQNIIQSLLDWNYN